MKTTNNETYYCHLPASAQGKAFQSQAGEALHPSVLLAEFFTAHPCIFKVEGYWTYELCHDKHIRQFRAEIVAPKQTRLVKEYYLGRLAVSEDKQPKEDLEKETGSNGGKEEPAVRISKRYFVPSWFFTLGKPFSVHFKPTMFNLLQLVWKQ